MKQLLVCFVKKINWIFLFLLFFSGCAELDGFFPKFSPQKKTEKTKPLPISSSVTKKQILLSEENLLLQKKIDELQRKVSELVKRQKEQREDFLLLQEQWEMNFILLERSVEESLFSKNTSELLDPSISEINQFKSHKIDKEKSNKVLHNSIPPVENYSLLKTTQRDITKKSIENNKITGNNNLDLEKQIIDVEEEPGFPEIGRVNLGDLEDTKGLVESESDVFFVGMESSRPDLESKKELKTNRSDFVDPDLNSPEAPLILIRHPGVKKIYNQGMTALIQKKHSQAILIFENFTERFPNNVDSDNAFYWIGRSYFELSDLKKAELAFRKVLTLYEHRPTSQGYKTPDSIYMLGKIEFKKNHQKRAYFYFEEVVKRFPDSAAARNAKRELDR